MVMQYNLAVAKGWVVVDGRHLWAQQHCSLLSGDDYATCSWTLIFHKVVQ